MDKLKKGRDIEQLFMHHWWEQNYAVWRPARAKFAEQDIFGLWDFAAMKEGRIDLVQVKRMRRDEVKAAQDAIVSFLRAKRPPVHAFMALWAARPGKRLFLSLQELTPDWQWKWVDAWFETL